MPGELPPKPSRRVGCRAGKRRNPRTAFATRALAEHMCTAVRDAHGADLAPYECPKCDQWHIKKRAAVAELVASR